MVHLQPTSSLEAARDELRQSSDRYVMTCCLEGPAEVALAEGDPRRCYVYADELLAVAGPNGLRELETVARRGEALFAEQANAAAHAELSQAATLAASIGRSRLQWDIEGALARVCAAEGEVVAARGHDAKAAKIAKAIAASLGSSGIEAQLVRTGDTGGEPFRI